MQCLIKGFLPTIVPHLSTGCVWYCSSDLFTSVVQYQTQYKERFGTVRGRNKFYFSNPGQPLRNSMADCAHVFVTGLYSSHLCLVHEWHKCPGWCHLLLEKMTLSGRVLAFRHKWTEGMSCTSSTNGHLRHLKEMRYGGRHSDTEKHLLKTVSHIGRSYFISLGGALLMPYFTWSCALLQLFTLLIKQLCK